MALTCAELRRLLDDESSNLDSPSVRAHLQECPSCRQAVTRWNDALGELRAWREEDPPSFLHGRVMAHLREAQSVPSRAVARGRRAWWIAPAIAGTFVAVVGGLVLWRAPWLGKPALDVAAPQTTAPSFERGPASPRLDDTGAAASGDVLKARPKKTLDAGGVPAEIPERRASVPQERPPELTVSRGYAPQPEEVREREAPPEAFREELGDAIRPLADAEGRSEPPGHGVTAPDAVPAPLSRGGAPGNRMEDEVASEADAPQATAPARGVVCLLVGPDASVEARRVLLPPSMAPPPGATWTVSVVSTGEVRADSPSPPRQASEEKDKQSRSEDGRVRAGWDRGTIPAPALEIIAGLGLDPGSYRLRRAP